MTATLTRPPSRTSVRLLEVASGIGRVDVEAGIIYDAKVCGLQSRNVGRTIGLDPRVFNGALDKPYRYAKQALESAIPMYEGAAVRIDHPQTEFDGDGRRVVKSRSRPALSTSGELKNVRMKEDGLYADIHLLKSHPNTAFVLEVAQRMPDKLALSQNANGVPELQGTEAVITRILQVYSVDIVGDRPGTTNGLFESCPEGETTVKRTIKQIIEGLADKSPARTILLEMAADQYAGKKLEEMEVEMAADAGPEVQVTDALRSVVMAIYDDESLDSAGKLAKLKEIFKMRDKLEGKEPTKPKAKDEEAVTTEESHLTDLENHPVVKQLMETVGTLTTERDSLKAASHARQLLESAGREATDVRIDAVVAAKSDQARKALIETWPKKDATPSSQRPRTSAPLLESHELQQAANAEEFARRVRA